MSTQRAPRAARATLAILLIGAGSCDSKSALLPGAPESDGVIEGSVSVEGVVMPGLVVRILGGSEQARETDEAGSYAFLGLLPGTYTVLVDGYPEDVSFDNSPTTATISGASAAARVNFRGRKKRDAVLDVLVSVEGAGLPGVSVSLSGPESRVGLTEADGSVGFQQLLAGWYDVVISGFDAAAHSFPSTEARVRARSGSVVEALFEGESVPEPPAAPSGLGAVAGGETSADLVWTDESDDETEFRLERREGAGPWGEVAVLGADTSAHTDTGLTASTGYTWRLQACGVAGCSDWSNEASATTDDPPPPPPPAAPSGLGAAAGGETSVELVWTDESDDETEFRLERREGAGPWGEVAVLGANTSAHTDTGLTASTAYTYRVRACGVAGCSDWSSEASVTTDDPPPPPPPAAPSGLGAAAGGETSADLVWTDESDDETEFRLERREGAGPWGEVAVLGANTSAHTDTGLTASTAYTYRVRACGVAGCSDWSNEASVTTDDPPPPPPPPPPPGGPNLSIAGMYVTQRTQRFAGDVPLIADLDGYLRVFAVADQANALTPEVRVRFYHGGALVHTVTIPSAGASVTMAVDEGDRDLSWNVLVPDWVIQPSLTVLADVDPSNTVAELDETDNHFPVNGLPVAMDVWDTPSFDVTFVPVRQSVNNLVGNVHAGNVDQFMTDARRLLPIAEDDVELHAEYTTNAPVLQSSNGNGAWGTILSELNALRVGEGSSRNYYGVVRTTYNSGVAGMGYIGLPTAIGWDKLPSGSSVAAHEWGHNFARRHSPGCGAGNPDASYPYAGGIIGVWGIDINTLAFKSPTTQYDFMSYCGPEWTSDYVYEKILQYRGTAPGMGGPSMAGSMRASNTTATGFSEPSLLLWGRVENGLLVLEPTFTIDAPTQLPEQGGEYALEGLGAAGESLFRFDFQPTPVGDGADGDGHFAFTVPLASFSIGALAEVRLSGVGSQPSIQRPSPAAAAAAPGVPQVVVTRRGAQAVELVWDGARYPMALVRDASTGEILTFARGGRSDVSPRSGTIEVSFSDGLRTGEPIVTRWR